MLNALGVRHLHLSPVSWAPAEKRGEMGQDCGYTVKT